MWLACERLGAQSTKHRWGEWGQVIAVTWCKRSWDDCFLFVFWQMALLLGFLTWLCKLTLDSCLLIHIIDENRERRRRGKKEEVEGEEKHRKDSGAGSNDSRKSCLEDEIPKLLKYHSSSGVSAQTPQWVVFLWAVIFHVLTTQKLKLEMITWLAHSTQK